MSGAGWWQSGTSLFFTSGYYSSYSGAATEGQIPASGSNFYLTFVNTVLADPNKLYSTPSNTPYISPGVEALTNGANSVFDQGPFQTVSGIYIN